MLTIHVWPRWVKEFLLTHPLYKSLGINLEFHDFSPPHAKRHRQATENIDAEQV